MPPGTAWSAVGAGPPVVLIHGLGLDRRMWRWQVPPLLSAGYRVVVCDLLGHGWSDRPRHAGGAYSVADLTESLSTALDEGAIGPAAYVGFSLGGAVALWLALSSPDRVTRLVLANTSAWMGPAANALFTSRAAVVEADGVEVLVQPAIQRWFTPAFVQTHRAEVETYKAILRENTPHGYAAACRALATFDVRDRLGAIHCPTLVLGGDCDQATPPAMARDLAVNIRGAALKILGPAGHLTTEECTDAFNDAVLQFMTTTPGACVPGAGPGTATGNGAPPA